MFGGFLIGLTAKIGMPVSAGWKRKAAARLQSKALRADAVEATICGYLSAVLTVGLAVTRLLPGWQRDSAAALARVPLLLKEGREAVAGECSYGESTMHIDWQQISALAIVAGAMLGVGRRLWGQIGAFRAKPGGKSSGSGCDGCASNKTEGKAPAAPVLVQIQTRPPAHLRRPSAK